MDHEKTRETLEKALRRGGEVLLGYYGNTFHTTVKESISSVVTEADLASEKAIMEVLNSSDPFSIISEEAGYMERGTEMTWVVDPLDGTSNFAAGLPWFGVIIALFEGNTPVLGGMYLPLEDHLYLASVGRGSTLNGKPVTTSESMDLASVLVSYSFDFSPLPEKTRSETELMGRLSKQVRNLRSTNSLVDFCYTADGRLGAAINQTTKIWDIAAPWLLIREAGGMVTDTAGNEIRFDLSPEGCRRNHTILAAGKGIHSLLLKIIQPKT
jgi:myo-inositol-1(or 4)-monophosphatase